MVEPSASRPRTLNQPRLSPWLSAVVICTLRVIPPMSPPLAAAWRTRPDEGACRSLGVPLMSVYGWTSRGGGRRFMKFGKHVRYKVADVEAWEHEHYVEQAN